MQNYEGMLFREALKTGCYDLQKARDTYRSFVQEEGMHQELVLQYAEVRLVPLQHGIDLFRAGLNISLVCQGIYALLPNAKT